MGEIILRVWRSAAPSGREGAAPGGAESRDAGGPTPGAGWEDYPVSYEAGATVLDGLETIRGGRDPDLLYRHSCHHGSCGTCGALIGGDPRLMCLARLEDLGPGPVDLAPLPTMDALADLAVSPGPLFRSLPRGAAYLRSSEVAHLARRLGSAAPDGLDAPDGRNAAEIRGAPEGSLGAGPTVAEDSGYSRMEDCIECALCVAACPVTVPFKGPAALAAADRDREERPWREAAELDFAAEEDGVAACERRFACSRACPQGVAPGRRIENLRRSLAKRDGA
jgi:succinate dehydrogenase/fumarate reductase iron-sulfur protein